MQHKKSKLFLMRLFLGLIVEVDFFEMEVELVEVIVAGILVVEVVEVVVVLVVVVLVSVVVVVVVVEVVVVGLAVVVVVVFFVVSKGAVNVAMSWTGVVSSTSSGTIILEFDLVVATLGTNGVGEVISSLTGIYVSSFWKRGNSSSMTNTVGSNCDDWESDADHDDPEDDDDDKDEEDPLDPLDDPTLISIFLITFIFEFRQFIAHGIDCFTYCPSSSFKTPQHFYLSG